MAIAKSIRTALDQVTDSVMEADSLVHAFLDLAGDSPPNILCPISRHIWRLKDQMENLESLLRTQALPILEDFSSVRGSK
jgi:hypothetical protein